MKTRNLFGWLAMTAMLVGTGCSTDEVVNDYSPNNAIQFGTYVGRNPESRAAATTLETLKDANWGFGVYAHYKVSNGTAGLTPNFMNNQKETWNTAAWEYNPVKYWPNNTGDEITFWAYAPWNTNNTSTEATAPSFKVADGTDYVAAQSVTKSKSNVDDVNDKVKFNFLHVMSKVGFKVEAIIDELEHAPSQGQSTTNGTTDEESDEANKGFDTAETNIVVTEVSLTGKLDVAGTYTWNADETAWKLVSTDGTGSKTHSLGITNFKTTDYYGYDSSVSPALTLNGQLATEEKVQLNNENSYLMLVPQVVDINITVKYSVITRDENLKAGYSKVDNEISSGDFNFTFEKGKAYNFVLHLGLTSVKLEAEKINDWENATDQVVNVPLNIADND